MSETAKPARRARAHPVLTSATWRSARRWSTSPAGRCPSSTPAASSPSTSRRAARRPVRRLPHGPVHVRGAGALPFLQHVLTNNAAALEVCQAQYTIIPDEPAAPSTTPISTASSRRVPAGRQRREPPQGLGSLRARLERLRRRRAHRRDRRDRHDRPAGPRGRATSSPALSRAGRCRSRCATSCRDARAAGSGGGRPLRVARSAAPATPASRSASSSSSRPSTAPALWDALVAGGAAPVGLGARDTLRLEAGLPLYGFELGTDERRRDPDLRHPAGQAGGELLAAQGRLRRPRRARSSARRLRADRLARLLAAEPTCRVMQPSPSPAAASPARRPVFAASAGGLRDERHLGALLGLRGRGSRLAQTDEHAQRSIALAYLDCDIVEDDEVTIDVRGKRVPGLVVPFHLRSDAPPLRAAIVYDHELPQLTELPRAARPAARPGGCSPTTLANTAWRQDECINLIPSEMTTSPLVRLALGHGPRLSLRRARKSEAFYDADLFYYQGTDFIARGRAPARSRARRLPRLRRDRDPRDQRADGQHGRLQRAGRLRSTAPTPRPSRGASAWS